MKREMKISLTFQKQAYAVFFVVILSLVRGVTYANEIGIALEAPLAILAFTCGLESEICQFFVYFAAIAVTLGFWGLLSNLISCLFRNMWVGIGSCMVLWLITNSSIGNRIFGAWNLFSYSFRKLENISDFSWIYGKAVCISIGIMAVAVLPEIIKKRG